MKTSINKKSLNKSKNETVFYARYDFSPNYPFISVIFKIYKFIFSINLNIKNLIESGHSKWLWKLSGKKRSLS